MHFCVMTRSQVYVSDKSTRSPRLWQRQLRRPQARAHRAKLLFGLASLGAAAELHGDMTQAARLASLDAFRKACLCRAACQCSLLLLDLEHEWK